MSSGAQRADEAEIAELIDQARAEARADVVAELRRRFADELLERALEALRAPVGRDAGLCVPGRGEPGRGPVGVGRAGTYLERRLAAGEEAARRVQLAAEAAGAWHDRLAEHAVATVLGRDQGPRVPLDAAYLVQAREQSGFDAVLFDLQDEA